MNASPNTDDPLTPDLTLSTASKLLKKPARRVVIRYFSAEETATAELTELAAHVHEEVDDITSSEQAQSTLVHTHLPKLAEHDVIEYDKRSETVRYRDGERLEQLLEVVVSNETLA
jgi:DNA-binding transcriptional ArsR family regulator